MSRIYYLSKMKHSLTCLCVLLFSVAGLAWAEDNPCLSGQHNFLNESYRSAGYDVRATDTRKCDNQLRRGWYRFTDANGKAAEIPNKCPGRNVCGTTTPVWMDGSYPNANDGIVLRSMCGNTDTTGTSGSCCDFQDTIFVKNCQGFNVYYLNPITSCPIGYCAGTTKRCPVEKWSLTGFEPCRDPAPVLTTKPVVKGPNIRENQTFDFQCKFEYGPKDADQEFQVLWTFNGKSDPKIKPTILSGSERVATLNGDLLKEHLDTEVACQVTSYYVPKRGQYTNGSNSNYFGVKTVELRGPNLRSSRSFDFECLVAFGSNDTEQQIEVIWTFDGKQDPNLQPQIINGGEKARLAGSALKGHLNSNVGCEARLIYEGYGIHTEFRKSITYFAGIQVIPNKVDIKASEGERDVTVTSTIPVVCDQGQGCCLTFNMIVDKTSVVTIKEACYYKICTSDWSDETKRASFNITVVPSRNAVGGAVRDAVLLFGNPVPSGSGGYIDIFKGYQPDPVQITVRLEAGFQCSMTGDPHFQGFDYRYMYNLYQTGDFTVYSVKDRDFLVQIRTWPYYSVTTVCGVVVKEKNDIIKVFGCDKTNLVYSTIDVPYKLSPGVVVQRSANGQHVGILLSSGSEIKIDIYALYMNVYIQTPAYDKNKAEGVCGTNDGIPENDFRHPDGTITPVCNTEWPRCTPVAFTESWRVTGNQSMFVVCPEKVPEQPATQYCACAVDATGKLKYTCSVRQHIDESKLACQGCQAITEDLKPVPWSQSEEEEDSYEQVTVKPVDPNKQWPNDQGLTEAQAKDLCNKAIQKSQLYNVCKSVDNLANNAMSECLSDILFGGTTDALDAITSSFTDRCQLKMAQNENNYVTGPDGGMNLKQEINKVCPIECLDHGQCSTVGQCVCQSGWEGETCQIEVGKGPQINPPTSGSLCDVSRKTCDTVRFDKSNVNIHDKLKCRVQPVNEQGTKAGQPVIVDAVDQSSATVTCPLPKSDKSSQKYTVSVSSDGATFGNEQPVQTFDSLCQNCSMPGCTPKKTACRINDVCYRNGEVNGQNQKQVCDISKSITDWSDVATFTGTTTASGIRTPSTTTDIKAGLIEILQGFMQQIADVIEKIRNL